MKPSESIKVHEPQYSPFSFFAPSYFIPLYGGVAQLIRNNMSQGCFILKLTKDYKSLHTRVVMSYGKKWHTLPFRVFVCEYPPEWYPPMIYV